MESTDRTLASLRGRIVSVPLRGLVKWKAHQRNTGVEEALQVSVPLRGLVKWKVPVAEASNCAGLEVSVPLRGLVKWKACSMSRTCKGETVWCFSPLTGIS